ncbi:hypothetical protein PspS35_04085 [Pseudomonas sp. S35]|uniref:hypothetical protein n=1 Tax=Pseudomonas sp. S35 TaxID=1573719 RepID=UPI00132F2B72|nr:hypothetical protein [Pseudomonas sp. S35]QHF43004.1 hypothetical protein PspS35_04085 [Pseudomonas sp. S35]
MTTHTSQGVAGRLGYALGVIVRAVWFSQNRTLRWVKRVALIAAAVFYSAGLFHWVASLFMALLTAGLVLLALVKGDSSSLKMSQDELSGQDDGFRYGLYGYGQYLNGVRTDAEEE